MLLVIEKCQDGMFNTLPMMCLVVVGGYSNIVHYFVIVSCFSVCVCVLCMFVAFVCVHLNTFITHTYVLLMC